MTQATAQRTHRKPPAGRKRPAGLDEPVLGTPQGLSDEELLVYSRIPPAMDHVSHESFDLPSAEAELFGPSAEEVEIPWWTSFPEVAEDVSSRRGPRKRLTASQEGLLFRRYNYARMRLGRLIEAQLRRVTLARGRQMIHWHQRVMKARADLVRGNLALVLAMAKRTKIPNVEFGEIVSEGNMALLRSVEKFDVSRGFKFSTYACRAILKSFNRLATKTGRYRQRFPTEYDPELERSDGDIQRRQAQRDGSVEAIREVLVRNRAGLSEVERTVVMERFAIATRGQRKTLSQVGEVVGLTNERVRQIQNRALLKIRQALSEDFITA